MPSPRGHRIPDPDRAPVAACGLGAAYMCATSRSLGCGPSGSAGFSAVHGGIPCGPDGSGASAGQRDCPGCGRRAARPLPIWGQFAWSGDAIGSLRAVDSGFPESTARNDGGGRPGARFVAFCPGSGGWAIRRSGGRAGEPWGHRSQQAQRYCVWDRAPESRPSERPASPRGREYQSRKRVPVPKTRSEFAAAYPAVIPQILSPAPPGGVEVGTATPLPLLIGEQRGQARGFAAKLPGDPPQCTALAAGQAHRGPLGGEACIQRDRNARGDPVLDANRSQAGFGITRDQVSQDRSQAAQFG
jgi:hypothetical protein